MITHAEPFRWTELIDEICAGTWINPLNGKQFPPAPFEKIVFEEDLAGKELQLVTSLGFKPPFALVCDERTFAALGERVSAALAKAGDVKEIILDKPHADLKSARALAKDLEGYESVIAVGSGTVNDLAKYVTAQDGRRYCVFATAGSMNGYTSSTASMTLDSGLKVSLPAHAPAGFFVDLNICASAPTYLTAAGFGDCLCRSVAQIDWWMSHRVLGTKYHHEPYLIEIPDEIRLNQHARGIKEGDVEATGYLFRVLTLCGLGISFTGVSHHGSMGEHQISHYLDCFAGDRHPGTLHGQQVGVATLTMARIQHQILSSETPPVVSATKIDFEDMKKRMGVDVATQCLEEYKMKAFDEAGAEAFNQKIASIWSELREECLAMAISVEQLESLLRAAGGPATAKELGVPVDLYQEAVLHAHEMRNRFSFADIACDSGILPQIVAREV